MYVYRAINDIEEQVLASGKDIKASKYDNTKFFESAAKHISVGSNVKQEDCWISASKDFNICASEYSIPQMGAYNTTRKEKEIIVIDRTYWTKRKISNYKFNGNFTVFVDKENRISFDLGDEKEFPRPQKKGGRYRYINNKRVCKKEQKNQIKSLLEGIEKGVDNGLFDMAFPSNGDRGGIIPVLNEFSMLDYIKSGIVAGCQKQPIASGIMKKSKEVLVLNRIPYNAIVKKLTKIEIMILYALSEEDFTVVLQDLIHKRLIINLNKSNVNINNNPITINKYEYELLSNFLVDIAYDKCKNGQNIEDYYEKLKKDKKKLLDNIVKNINSSYSASKIQDDEVFVKRVDFNNITLVDKLQSYDLLVIQDISDNKIYSYKDNNYNDILKKIIK